MTGRTLIGAMLATILALSACSEERVTRSYSFDQVVTNLDIHVEAANVYVSGDDSGRIYVDVDLTHRGGRPHHRAYVENGVLNVDVSCDGDCWDLGGRVDLLVPANIDAWVESGAGDLHLGGLHGVIDAETGAGDLEVRGCGGDLRLSTGAGDIRAERLEVDDIVADSGSGDVLLTLDQEPWFVGVETGAGDVDVELPSGEYDLEISVGVGDIHIDNIDDSSWASRQIEVDVGVGDVTILGY